MGSFSIWHWVIVLGLVGAVVYAVMKSRKPKLATAIADGGTGTAHVEPRGLGGWLVFLVIGQIGGILRVLKAIVEDIDLLGQAVPNTKAAVIAELTLNVAFLGLVIYVTVSMFRELRTFPTLWKVQATAAVLVPLLDAVLVAGLLNLPIGKVLEEGMIGQLIGMVIAIAIWTWYLSVSKRVRNTFVK